LTKAAIAKCDHVIVAHKAIEKAAKAGAFAYAPGVLRSLKLPRMHCAGFLHLGRLVVIKWGKGRVVFRSGAMPLVIAKTYAAFGTEDRKIQAKY
jgi:hypothetical protein